MTPKTSPAGFSIDILLEISNKHVEFITHQDLRKTKPAPERSAIDIIAHDSARVLGSFIFGLDEDDSGGILHKNKIRLYQSAKGCIRF